MAASARSIGPARPANPPPGPGYDGPMTTEPGEPRPKLDRAPGERYLRAESDVAAGDASLIWPPLAVMIGGAIGYTVLGGMLGVTAGLLVLAAFLGWLLGKVVSPPSRAAAAGLGTIALGLVGIWLFGRLEGGVLDPITYLDDVQGWPLVALQLAIGSALAAASSR